MYWVLGAIMHWVHIICVYDLYGVLGALIMYMIIMILYCVLRAIMHWVHIICVYDSVWSARSSYALSARTQYTILLYVYETGLVFALDSFSYTLSHDISIHNMCFVSTYYMMYWYIMTQSIIWVHNMSIHHMYLIHMMCFMRMRPGLFSQYTFSYMISRFHTWFRSRHVFMTQLSHDMSIHEKSVLWVHIMEQS